MSADLAAVLGPDEKDPKPICSGCGHDECKHSKPDRSCVFAGLCNCKGWNVPVERVPVSCSDCGCPMRVVPEEADDAKCSTCMVREVRDEC